MSFLYNNIAAIAVAFAASLMAWMFGGSRGEVLVPVMPWVFVFVLEIVLCFPQCHHGETAYEARDRVWHSLKRSQIFWVSFALFAILMIPFANNGLCPSCDVAAIAHGMKADPPLGGLPFCVNRIDHLHVVIWFAMTLLSVVAVHHCLTRPGKRLVLELIVWNGAALAIFGFIQGAMKAPGPFWTMGADGRPVGDFFASFGYPNMAGAYFTMLFGLAVALWRDRCDQLHAEAKSMDPSELAGKDSAHADVVFWWRHYFLLPAAIFFFAALNTLSRAAIILVTSLAIISFLHALFAVLSRMRKSKRVTVGVWSMVIFGMIIFFSTISMPGKIQREVDSLDSITMLDRVTGRGQYHADVALALWRDHKIFGCGGWGYKHFCRSKMKDLKINIKSMQTVGGANVHNDYLQFLCEHGIAGVGAMVVLIVLMLVPIFKQWMDTLHDMRFQKLKNPKKAPNKLFSIPAPVFTIFITLIATMIHAFGDCPFRSGAVLMLFFISIAALPGFMPRVVFAIPSHHHNHHENN